MSLEFGASKEISFDAFEAVRRALEMDARYALLPSTEPNRILGRFAKYAVREKWPEDIEVVFDGRKLRVLFHSGHRVDILAFLAALKAALADNGYDCAFDEE